MGKRQPIPIAQQLRQQLEQGETPRFLPPGRHGLGRDVVKASQRLRIAEGVMAAVASKGYDATTIQDIVGRAGVSKKAFYENFENKEAAFAAAYVALGAGVNTAVTEAVAAADTWEDALPAGIEALLEYFAQHGDFAQVWATHLMTAGERIVEMVMIGDEVYLRILRALHAAMREQIPDLPEASDETIWALVGAISEVLRRQIRQHGAESVTELKPVIVGLACAVLGAPATVEALTPASITRARGE
jgi:AcrR family transcriptional regulator